MWYVQDDQGNPVPIYSADDPRLTERYRKIDAGEPDPNRVARDTIRGWDVSTVFLSIDHQFDDGPPVLWETMVFGPEPWGDWQDRYTSRAAAVAGHARVVAMIESGAEPPA